MGIALSGTATTYNNTGSSTITLTCPSGAKAGDLMVAVIADSTTGSGSGISAVPSGWTGPDSPQSPGGGSAFGMYYQYILSTDTPGTTTYQWTLAGSHRVAGSLQAFSGVYSLQALDNSGADHAGKNSGTATTSPTLPSLTSHSPEAWIIGGLGGRNNTSGVTNNSTTVPTNWTKVPSSDNQSTAGANNNAITCLMYQKITGTPSSFTCTLVNSSTYGAFCFALFPEPPGNTFQVNRAPIVRASIW